MLKSKAIILICLLCSLAASAQQATISGVVSDSITNEKIAFASVRLFSQTDSSYIKGTSTNEKGAFRLQATAGKYAVEVSFLGYKSQRQHISLTKENLNLGNIYLLNDSLMLDEAVIIAKVPDVQVKGDTIEYNAEAYISDENALLQDIVKKLPGIEVDENGNLTANGKPITKILVDGKEFFDNDIKMALENLPANMIKKLQLFKEESENTKVTGFKDGEEQQVLNLKIKDEYKRNLFGDARLGYGNNDTYSNRLMANYMHDNNQFSVIGNMNNVNNDMNIGGGYSSLYSGVDKNKNIGTNFSIQGSEKFRITSNIRYADNSNLFISDSHSEYFSPNRISTQHSSADNHRKNLNTSSYVEWKPDSLTTIFFRTSGAYSRTQNNRESDSKAFAQNDTTSTNNNNYTVNDSYQISSSLTIGRKLNDKGRNISVSLNGTFRDENGDGMNYSKTTYTSGANDLILDQSIINHNISRNWGAQLSYVEPLSEKNSIMLSYSYTQNSSNRDRKTLIKDSEGNYTVLDKNYSRKSENFFSNQYINLGFQSQQEKYEYNIGISIQPSYSRRETAVEDSIIEKQKQRVVDYSPTIRFAYRPNDNKSLNIDYSGNSTHPGISQLSGDTIRSASGTSKTYGNPDLKTSFRNSLNIFYHQSNFETNRFLMLTGSLNYTFNHIAYYTKTDSLFNTESTYKNVDGNWTANTGIIYNTPFRNKKFTFETNTFVNFSRNVGFLNGEKSITKSWSLNETIALSFRSEKFETRLQVSYSCNIADNNINTLDSRNTSGFGARNTLTWRLPFDFTLQNELNFTYNSGYSSDFKKTEILWNAAISKQLLKKKGTLKAQFFDILKDRNNVSRTTTANEISDTKTNSMSRYFMVSFSYRFNFNKNNKKADESYDEYMY